MEFEWDEDKNRINIKKHGISFKYAARVFDDEHYFEQYDEYHSDDEDRYNIIGMVDEILFVVVTYRQDNVIRIISARKADTRERRLYYGNY